MTEFILKLIIIFAIILAAGLVAQIRAGMSKK